MKNKWWQRLFYKMLRANMICSMQNRNIPGATINSILSAFRLRPISGLFEINWHPNIESMRNDLQISERKVNQLKEEINLLKNPLPEPKFKIGQTFGIFAVSRVGTSACNPYEAVDKNGNINFFNENQIEAMMKLNKES